MSKNSAPESQPQSQAQAQAQAQAQIRARAQAQAQVKSKTLDIAKPNDEFVKNINRQSRIFTAVALLFCSAVYFSLSAYYGGDPVSTQSRFNTVFQTLLIGAWTWFMFPYIRVTLQMMLYGLQLNERTASFFSKPEESPLVQYLEKRLAAERGKVEETLGVWKRVGEKVEAELPAVLKKIDEGFKDLKDAAQKISSVIEKNEAIAAEARPAIEALRRIEAKFEEEIKKGFFEKAHAALDSVRTMGGLPPNEPEEKEDLSFALNSIRKNKAVGRPNA